MNHVCCRQGCHEDQFASLSSLEMSAKNYSSRLRYLDLWYFSSLIISQITIIN
jgi:hypothetical protein